MTQREREKILEICREAVSLVTEGPGSSKNREDLETKKFRLIDLYMAGNLREAEDLAYCIIQLWFGNKL